MNKFFVLLIALSALSLINMQEENGEAYYDSFMSKNSKFIAGNCNDIFTKDKTKLVALVDSFIALQKKGEKVENIVRMTAYDYLKIEGIASTCNMLIIIYFYTQFFTDPRTAFDLSYQAYWRADKINPKLYQITESIKQGDYVQASYVFSDVMINIVGLK